MPRNGFVVCNTKKFNKHFLETITRKFSYELQRESPEWAEEAKVYTCDIYTGFPVDVFVFPEEELVVFKKLLDTFQR